MKHLLVLLPAVTLFFLPRAEAAGSLAQNFQQPPPAARPWVYWFWNNGNVTSNGITADLEAMQRVGIGGVLIMDVKERFAPPQGTAEFMNAEWQNLFQFSVQEAARLGLEINMANGPGWCGSSGPWITPELSMQMLVSASTSVTGPAHFSGVVPHPDTAAGKHGHNKVFDSTVKFEDYYRDIAVLAFPKTSNGIFPHDAVVDLTAKLNADGKLDWDAPAGDWIIERIGHTTTGSSTRPPVAGGNGLECDKLSAAAMDAHFAGMMAKLIQTAGPLAGKSLVATHIDSWEVGSQNWTPKLREEFKQRRGYDPLPWLPSLTDTVREKVGNKVTPRFSHIPDNPEATARFHWDFYQTIAELLAENYSGRMEKLAQAHGLRYSLEGYTLPFGDEYTYTARADEPMTEFWTGNKFSAGYTDTRAQQAASVAHVYGHAILGAEAFTSGDKEMWKATPADIKALGDFEFCMGVNRFVFHRYAHQPYLDRAPGATMGPWGLHYERTQTWWEMSGAWHEYLARCQYLLRQGIFVADLLYLRPESPNQTTFTPNPPPPAGYRFDQISAEALQQRVLVQNGKLVLPDDMSYRVLVLPPVKTMTSVLLEKIKELNRAGAIVVATGARPQTSPSLQDFPHCDDTVARLSGELWGDGDGKTVTEYSPGKGRFVWGQPLEKVLADLKAPADFAANVNLNWIHRRADGAEIYFVANPASTAVEARCTFRVPGLRPEWWNPETGETTLLAAYEATAAGTTVPLRFGPSGSGFIVFRQSAPDFDPVVGFLRNGQPLLETVPKTGDLKIVSASYGVPGDAARTRDVRDQVQALVAGGQTTFQVADLAKAGDPAYGVVKTLALEFIAAGKTCQATGKDPDTLTLRALVPPLERPAEIICDAAGHLRLAARESGRYEWITASGQTNRLEVAEVLPPLEIKGPWRLAFPPKWGAPESVTLTNLISWTDSADAGVKCFSGTATYRTTFDFSDAKFKAQKLKCFLTLGEVRVMARVKVNGQDCGVTWHPPFRVEITGAVHAGTNALEIQVANLWPNRMIGDAAQPAEKRFT